MNLPNSLLIGSASIEATLIKAQLRWCGHVVRMVRMDSTRLPRQVLYSELCSGKRNTGRPCKRFKDNLKLYLKTGQADPKTLETMAADRQAWREFTKRTGKVAEEDRHARRVASKARRAARALQPLNPATAATCSICGRVCASSFGLRSHSRIHRT